MYSMCLWDTEGSINAYFFFVLDFLFLYSSPGGEAVERLLLLMSSGL